MNIKGVILFGDSVFFGYGASNKNLGCGRLLKKMYGKKPILIKAKNSDTTHDALRKIETNVLTQERYSHILILFGNNDSRLIGINKPICTVREYKENLIKMIYFVRKAKKHPIICNLQPLDDILFYKTLPETKEFVEMDETPDSWHKQYSDTALSVAKKLNTPSVDIETPLRRLGKEAMYGDGLHPNDIGHKKIADVVKEKILELEKE
ncbi:MAG: SGNH/GDSL hydrolase family protein [Candidatus Omnitrophica bacterium]|nr:SGNH/GDSL hydrolase family protein [Candidatus Omnitrophota bacterium]